MVISLLTFVVMQLPEGDYVTELIRQAERQVGDDARAYESQMREFYGLDKPAWQQYYRWISRIVTKLEFADSFGTLDNTYDNGRSVKEMLQQPIKLTIALTAFTISLTWLMGIPIGIYSAIRQHTIGDYFFTFIGFSGLAVPDYLLGLVLMYVFYAYFDMSVGGLFSGDYQLAGWGYGKVMDLLRHMIIPAIVLGTSGTAGLIRIMRNNLLDELGRPYVTTARAKGLVGWKTILKYPVRVAINPFISGIGQMLPRAGRRQRDSLGGAQSADCGPDSPGRDHETRHVRGGGHHPASRASVRHRDPYLRHPLGRRRPPHQALRSVEKGVPKYALTVVCARLHQSGWDYGPYGLTLV